MSDIITQEGSFEWAMLQLKQGKRVAREGWNGKDMYLIRNPGLVAQKVEEGDYRALAGVEVGKEFDLLPNIEMCNADGNFVPWVASNADIKATDWEDIDYFTGKELLKFNITPGQILVTGRVSLYGYGHYLGSNYGSLTILENQLKIEKVDTLCWENLQKALTFRFYCIGESHKEKIVKLFANNEVEFYANDKVYSLGNVSPLGIIKYSNEKFSISFDFSNAKDKSGFFYDVLKKDKVRTEVTLRVSNNN